MTHEDFRLFLAKIDGLAFLLVNYVTMDFLLHNKTVNLLNNFDKWYINGTWRQVNDPQNPGAMVFRNYPCAFPLNLWNVYMPTLNDDPRMICES